MSESQESSSEAPRPSSGRWTFPQPRIEKILAGEKGGVMVDKTMLLTLRRRTSSASGPCCTRWPPGSFCLSTVHCSPGINCLSVCTLPASSKCTDRRDRDVDPPKEEDLKVDGERRECPELLGLGAWDDNISSGDFSCRESGDRVGSMSSERDASRPCGLLPKLDQFHGTVALPPRRGECEGSSRASLNGLVSSRTLLTLPRDVCLALESLSDARSGLGFGVEGIKP